MAQTQPTIAAGLAAPAPGLLERFLRAREGLVVAAIVGIAATYFAAQWKLSAMAFALLLGMALNFLGRDPLCAPGIEMASRLVLRTGVALLGLRVTVGEVLGLGWGTVILTVCAIALTIGFGILMARWLRLDERFGVLSGGAVSICGASAALAISSVLPRGEQSQRDASFVVISVTLLSTVAMFLYPVMTRVLGMDDHTAGIFFGGTIHDVAQVVGAGYSVSDAAGNTATIVKLLRVAMLLPVCLAIGLVLHSRRRRAAERWTAVPWFVIAFGALVIATSAGWLPPAVVESGKSVSAWFLVTAMAAIGLKTSLRSLAQVGPRAVMLVVAETAFLALLALFFLR